MQRWTFLGLVLAAGLAAASGQETGGGKDRLLRRFADEFVPLTPGESKFPGAFRMGSPGDAPDAEKPAHRVIPKQPFAVARYEVTQELYETVTGHNPSKWKGPRNSVEMVSWDEANDFCRKVTEELRRRKLLRDDEVIRLPSEAEWEYACRAGTTTPYSFDGGEQELQDFAWFKANSKGEDPPVGKKKPNPWGLYDLHGYVWEWCQDAWHPSYQGAPTDGTAWEEKGAKERVLRGGSWADPADACRSATRHHQPADTRSDTIGFRCVRAAVVPGKARTQAPTDWPQFLGPERNGVSPETGLVANWPKEGPPRLWQYAIGEGFSSPVVVGDRLILFHRVGDEEVVECLGAADGRPRWRFAYPTSYRDPYGKGDGPRATPVVAGGRVFTLGAAGRLHALDLASGKKLWDHALLEEYRVPQSFFGVGTSPIVAGDKLLINVGGRGAGVVAFDCGTGKEAWKATDQGASYASPTAATVDGVRHLIFLTRQGLLSLNPADGAVRFSKPWRARINASVNAATPLVLDGHVFVTASYDTGAGLFKITRDGLEEVWTGDESLSAHYDTPLPAGNFLYGIDGRQESGARLRCIEWKTGKVRWTKEGFGCAAGLRADGRLIFLTENGELVLLEPSPEGYRELARAAVLDGPCRATPALSAGRLYVRDNRQLICFDLKTK